MIFYLTQNHFGGKREMSTKITPRLRARIVAAVSAGALILAIPAVASAATYNVSTTAGLQSAVTSINTLHSSSNDTIVIAPGTYAPTSTLEFGADSHTGTITIENGGTGRLTLAGSSVQPFPSDFIVVDSGDTLILDDLDVTASASGQSAINDSGDLQLNDSALTGNNGAALTVNGGATAEISASTIGANSGVGIEDLGTATLSSATIASNVGGIDNASGTLSLTNSIVASNSHFNCTAAANTVDDSLDSDGTCGVNAPLSSVAAHLNSLATLPGGNTPGYTLQSTSPAIGHGDGSQAPLYDQRNDYYGTPRDVGAVAYTVGTPAQQSQTVTFTSTNPSPAAPYTTYTPAATASSGQPVTYSLDPSTVAGVCQISSGVVTFVNAGTCYIDAYQVGNAAYFAASAQQAVTVAGQITQTISAITFNGSSTPPSNPTGGSTYTLAATASSGGPVVFSLDSSSTAGACNLSGNTLTIGYTAGTCKVDAYQVGNASYTPVLGQATVTVSSLQSQTVTFGAPAPTSPAPYSTYTPTATATSGGPVVISLDPSTANGACQINSGVVTFITPGAVCIIDAYQVGSATYSPGLAQQSVTVGP
jgi:hypothetical protein